MFLFEGGDSYLESTPRPRTSNPALTRAKSPVSWRATKNRSAKVRGWEYSPESVLTSVREGEAEQCACHLHASSLRATSFHVKWTHSQSLVGI